jgi:hypothetical protein
MMGVPCGLGFGHRKSTGRHVGREDGKQGTASVEYICTLGVISVEALLTPRVLSANKEWDGQQR